MGHCYGIFLTVARFLLNRAAIEITPPSDSVSPPTITGRLHVLTALRLHRAHSHAYGEVLLNHQRRINKVSEKRTVAQIAAAYERFARIAVIKAETPKAIAIKEPKTAPMRARNPMS